MANNLSHSATTIGIAVAPAEVRTVNVGNVNKKVLEVRVANNSRDYKDQNGVWQKRPVFVSARRWYSEDAKIENFAKVITKGAMVVVKGCPIAEAYITKDGKAAANIIYENADIELLKKNSASESGTTEEKAPIETAPKENESDDLPF